MASPCKLVNPSIIRPSQSHSVSTSPSSHNPSPVSLNQSRFLFSSSTNPSALYSHRLNSAAAHTISRRLFLPSVSGIWDALTGGGNNPREAILAVRRGMSLFRQGDVAGSLAEFDKAMELDPRQKAYLWQRGLSLYYLNSIDSKKEQSSSG